MSNEHTCDECIHYDFDKCTGHNEGQVRYGQSEACEGFELAPEIPDFVGTRNALDSLSAIVVCS